MDKIEQNRDTTYSVLSGDALDNVVGIFYEAARLERASDQGVDGAYVLVPSDVNLENTGVQIIALFDRLPEGHPIRQKHDITEFMDGYRAIVSGKVKQQPKVGPNPSDGNLSALLKAAGL